MIPAVDSTLGMLGDIYSILILIAFYSLSDTNVQEHFYKHEFSTKSYLLPIAQMEFVLLAAIGVQPKFSIPSQHKPYFTLTL